MSNKYYIRIDTTKLPKSETLSEKVNRFINEYSFISTNNMYHFFQPEYRTIPNGVYEMKFELEEKADFVACKEVIRDKLFSYTGIYASFDIESPDRSNSFNPWFGYYLKRVNLVVDDPENFVMSFDPETRLLLGTSARSEELALNIRDGYIRNYQTTSEALSLALYKKGNFYDEYYESYYECYDDENEEEDLKIGWTFDELRALEPVKYVTGRYNEYYVGYNFILPKPKPLSDDIIKASKKKDLEYECSSLEQEIRSLQNKLEELKEQLNNLKED